MQVKDSKRDMKRRWSKRLRRSLKYLKGIGTIKYCPKNNKLGNWVNDLMHNSSMTNPLATCLTAIDMTYNTSNIPRMDNIIWMDTDSVPIGIYNRCSLCISHVPEDFVGNLIPSNIKIEGFGGILSPRIQVGTLLWRWNDDQGQEHKLLIPNSLYIPSGKCRFLSPQQWAQTR